MSNEKFTLQVVLVSSGPMVLCSVLHTLDCFPHLLRDTLIYSILCTSTKDFENFYDIPTYHLLEFLLLNHKNKT